MRELTLAQGDSGSAEGARWPKPLGGCCPHGRAARRALGLLPQASAGLSQEQPAGRGTPSAEAFDAAACMKKGGSMSMVKRRSSKAAPAAAVSTRASVDSHLSTRMIVSAVDITRCSLNSATLRVPTRRSKRLQRRGKGQHTHAAPDRGRRTKEGGEAAKRHVRFDA